MSSRTVHHGAFLLRTGLARPRRCPDMLHLRPRSSYAKSTGYHTASNARAGVYNGRLVSLVGVITAASFGLWLHQNGLQVQLLQSALADEPVTPHVALDETPIHLDPDTSIPFPASITPIGSSSGALKLVGLGVRTVSFIRVKVYSAGAYFSEKALTSVRGHREEGQGEGLVSYLLDQPYDVSVRIVPTRNTDHSHLRDGFVRAMLARMKQATSAGQLTDEQAEQAGNDLDHFKGFFPSGKVSKGKYMLVTRRGSDGALLLEYEGKLLGTLKNTFLSKQMLLAYFADNDKEISPKLKADVMTSLERYL